jgi:hypothetical protein
VLIVDDHEDDRRSSALLGAEGSRSWARQPTAPRRSTRLAATRDPPNVVLSSSHEAAAYGSRLDVAPARGFIAKRELSGAAPAALVA